MTPEPELKKSQIAKKLLLPLLLIVKKWKSGKKGKGKC